MDKLVRYNGKCEDTYGSSPPFKLKVGEVYHVIDVQAFGRTQEYILEGIHGRFNSTWFDDVYDVSLAVSDHIPEIGSIIKACKFSLSGKTVKIENVSILVKEILETEINTYRIVSHDGGHYILKVYMS